MARRRRTEARLAARLVGATTVAAIAATSRRLVRGPLVPTWTLGMEVRVRTLRALIRVSAEPDLAATARRWGERFDPPVPRHLRRVLRVEPAVVGGCRGEWIVRDHADGELTDAAIILYLHGGAYVAGSPASHRHFTSRITWAAHARTFVPDYRLAPEHPFPAAVDDAEAVYQGLLATGIPPSTLVLAGDSAGGGLACALLLRLRDGGVPLPAGAVLFSPYTDVEHTGASIRRNAATDYIPIVGEITANLDYLGDADPRNPLASPLYGEFSGMPPLLIFAGGREMALDDSLRLSERARAAGVDVTLHLEPDMMHVWPGIVPGHPASLRALAHMAEWIGALAR